MYVKKIEFESLNFQFRLFTCNYMYMCGNNQIVHLHCSTQELILIHVHVHVRPFVIKTIVKKSLGLLLWVFSTGTL